MHRGLATLVLLAAWACCLARGAAGQQQEAAPPLSTLYKCPIRESELFQSSCGRRCRHTTEAALRRIYNTLDGPSWNFEAVESGRPRDNGGWGQCSACALTRSHNAIPAGAILPSYCCWTGVFCCSEYVALQRDAATLFNSSLCEPYSVILLQLRSAGVTGNLSAVMRDLQLLHDNGLRQLDISRNNLGSTLPPELGNLKQLDALLLSSNYLTGTVPASLGQLHQLQQLDLEFNLLKGQVPSGPTGGLCSINSSRLATLTLRANDFSGPLDLRHCRELAMVDLSENGFSGSLPISGSNLLLSAFRARTNNFSGTIPDQVWELPLLMSLDLTSNSISGTLPQSVASTSYLSSLQLGSNLLYGTIPAGLAQSTALTVLDLSDNSWIVGTLPNMTWMLGLQTLRVGNTRLQGTIPAELKNLPYLTSVDIHNTLMTCCGDEADADAKAQQPGGLLPDYLAFSNTSSVPPSDEVMPRDPDFRQYMAVGDNMMCKTVVRDPAFPTASNKLVLRPANLSTQAWVVDPEYYWFKECQCNPNYRKGSRIDRVFWCNVTSYLESGQPWDVAQHCVNMSVMTCTKDDGGVSREQAITIAVLGFAGLLLLVMITSLTLNMCFTRAGKVRRQLEAWRKHMAGMPKAGRMSIVITDIEGYSDLFKRCPEQMYKALTLHNNVIRRAKYNNCGSTVQQEGDSYTLVFHTAFDAVAFCLQTQQALMEVSWPEGLMAESSGGGSSHKSGSKARRLKLPEFGDGGWRFRSRTKGQKSLRGSMKLSVISQGSLAPGGSTALEFPPSANGIAPGGSNTSHHCCQLSAAAAAQHQQPGGSSRSRMRDLLLASSGGEAVMLFNGLRVRMGVVTGEVEKAEPGSNALQNIMNSSLYKLALDVSDAGNGGQIILDEPTFARIKEELHPLGAVDGSGLNYNKLAQRTSLWHLLCLGTLWSRRRHDVLDCDEAVVLDMGEYQLPPQAPKVNSLGAGALTMMRQSLKIPAALMLMPRGGAASPSPPAASPTQQLQQQQHRHTFSTGTDFGFDLDPTSSLPGAMPCDVVAAALRQHQHGGGTAAAAAGSGMLRQRVRLLQILAPSLVGRAAVWGNKLSLKASWECTDAPYFEAPGAREAPLGATGSLFSSSMQLIPRQQHQQPQQPQQQLQRLHSGGEQLSTASSYNSVDSGGLAAAAAASSVASSAAAVSAVSAGPPGVSFDIESQASSLGDQQQPPQWAQQQQHHQQSQLPPLYQPVPPVTMVFMVVEGAKVFGARKRQLLKDIHSHLSALLMEALRHVPGGYLCRMQEGDLKYMIAFASARSALEWCLLVQEAAMYLNWPDETDRWHRNSFLRSAYDSSGALVFRGPRLKMGLCEGCPRTIIPDHLGRADYHGASVNQAARFMDAGAHGGQIACEAGLALAVLRQWAAPDDSSSLAGSDSLSPGVARTVSAPAAGAAAAAAAAAMAAGGSSSSGAAAAGGDDTSLLLCEETADGTLRALTSKSLDSALTNSVVAAALGDPLLRPQQQQHLADTAAADDTSSGSNLSRLVSIGTPFGTAVPAAAAAAAAASSDDAEAAVSPAAASQQQQQQLRFGPTSSSAVAFAHHGSSVSANAGGGGSANGSTGRLSRFFARKQQPQPASHMALGGGLGHAVAAAAAGRVSPQEDAPRIFGLSEVPTAPAAVEVHALGLFKFKGSPAPIEMANVMLAALAGRTAFFPADPPKGKGGRVAARSGVLACGSAPLPTLALQYRSRVPDHILHLPTGGQLSGVHGSGPAWLRTNSLPARASQGFGDGEASGPNSRSGSSSVVLPSPGRQEAAGGSGGGGDTGGSGSSGAVRFNVGIRSRSVVAPRSGSGSSGGQQQAAAEAMISLAVLRQQQQLLRLQREAAVSAGSGSACQRVTEEVAQA